MPKFSATAKVRSVERRQDHGETGKKEKKPPEKIFVRVEGDSFDATLKWGDGEPPTVDSVVKASFDFAYGGNETDDGMGEEETPTLGLEEDEKEDGY